MNRRDIRMIERRQYLRLALETRHAVGIRGESVGQQFDRDLAPELRVGGAPDLTHAALAELGGDAVVRDGLLRTHGVRISGIVSLSRRFGPLTLLGRNPAWWTDTLVDEKWAS